MVEFLIFLVIASIRFVFYSSRVSSFVVLVIFFPFFIFPFITSFRCMRNVFPWSIPFCVVKAFKNVLHISFIIVDACSLLWMSPSRLRYLASIEGAAFLKLRKIYERGDGLIVLSAHLGNWEILGASFCLCSIILYVLYRPLDNPLLGYIVSYLRRRWGIQTISKFSGSRPIHNALENKKVVGFVCDQRAVRYGVPVTFFERSVLAVRGPAYYARKYPHIPIVILNNIRRADGSLFVICEELCLLASDRAVRDAFQFEQNFTQRVHQHFEDHIRLCPEQWLWNHPGRWARRKSGH